MTAAADTFRAEAARRILVKDGAYGTMIQAEKLAEADYRGDLAFTLDQRGNNDLLNLTRPDLIAAICRRFVDGGADLLATNTFNATAISQSDYGPEAVALSDEMNRASARIIRSASPTPPPPPTGVRAGSRGRSGRPTRPSRCRPGSTIRVSAKSTMTRSKPPIARRSTRSSMAGSISSSSRRCSIRSMPRPRSWR